MQIFCCACNHNVDARLTSGEEIYSSGYEDLPFWICDVCNNYVGCHHKSKNKTCPLGCIPTPEIRKMRGYLHKIIDKEWKSDKTKRKGIYNKISEAVGYEYHTAEIKTVAEAKRVYAICKNKLQF